MTNKFAFMFVLSVTENWFVSKSFCAISDGKLLYCS